MRDSRDEIQQLLRERRYQDLIGLCESALETHPEQYEFYYYLGLGYLSLGDEIAAQEVWMSALLADDADEGGRKLREILAREIDNALSRLDLVRVSIMSAQILSIDDSYSNPEIDNKITTLVNSLLEAVKKAEEVKDWPKAIEIYNQLLGWDDTVVAHWYGLALSYYHDQQYVYSIDALKMALSLDDRVADHHYLMGLICDRENNPTVALQAYRKTLELDPNYASAYHNLGNIYYKIGDLNSAQEYYRKSIELSPYYFPSYINLGSVLLVDQDLKGAESLYLQADSIQSGRIEVKKNLDLVNYLKSNPQLPISYSGEFFYGIKDYGRAIEQYQKLWGTPVEQPDFYLHLANSYIELKKKAEALRVYDEGIKYHPDNADLYLCKIWALQDIRPIEEAIAFTRLCVDLFPHRLSFQLELMRLMPIVYKTRTEIAHYRNKYTRYLDEIILTTPGNSPEAKEDALRSIGLRTNFYLQYQGENDLGLQQKYGELVYKIMKANYPQWVQPLTIPQVTEGEKIRIGYLSAHLRQHTVAKLFLGWLEHHQQDEFEIYCYATDINNITDSYTQKYINQSEHFYQFDLSYKLEDICQLILRDKLHILVFLDIGMDARTGQLAGLRLAPIQCVTWGHPVTTGLPTIDYFISSELMEPKSFASHYSEKVVRLPHLSISYPPPDLPETRKDRSNFNLGEDKIIYLSCQSLFKYLPQNDYIFAEIAKLVPNCQLVFIAHGSSFVTETFAERLQRIFQEAGLNWHEYGVILPKLNQEDYFHVNLLADIYLDNLSWSGGNTTLEAVACGLPIVTCPGELMRARHSYAILRMLGISETIATCEQQYIDIAVRLGSDLRWREEIRSKVNSNKQKVFNDITCVKALENFYRSVVYMIK